MYEKIQKEIKQKYYEDNYAMIEPPSYVVASKFSHWVEAMDSELACLQQQHT